MRESVIYQEILSRGEEIGQKLGEQIGEQRERSLILRLLTRRVGELSQQTITRIDALSLEELENLGEALLDFEAMVDLEVWLSALE
ncbi:MAG: DUF4351 domain-containing protein [Stigonema ocellatum SAG 48.90 = DSM 106950]|nr:DUF4351 domain-containing protein [Stigonema ocellatum SAG 48.90 = DSM 106950]